MGREEAWRAKRLIESEGGRYLCLRRRRPPPAEEADDEALESHQVIVRSSAEPETATETETETETEAEAAASERLGQRREDKLERDESCLFAALAPDYHRHHHCRDNLQRTGPEEEEHKTRRRRSMEKTTTTARLALALSLLLLMTSSRSRNHNANCDRATLGTFAFLLVGAQDVAPQQQHHHHHHHQLPEDAQQIQTRPSQSFRRKLEPHYERTAGDSVVLSCEVAEQAGEAFWVYRQSNSSTHLFARNGHRDEGAKGANRKEERYVLLGDPQSGNHTLELRQLQAEDSGEYECQITPAPWDTYGLELRTSTRLTVNQPPPPPPALEASTDPAPNHQLDPQHHMMMTKLEQSSAFQPAQLHHNQHRNPAGSSVILAGSSSAASSAHPTAASTTSASTIPTSAGSFGGLALAWPNLLLLLAALLMLANVYLIYSLVQRHRRNQRQRNKQQAYRQAPSDSSVESAATTSSSSSSSGAASNNGSSSAASAVTTTSRLATTTTHPELFCTELDLSSSTMAAAVGSAHLEPPARCQSATLGLQQHHLSHPQRFSPSVNLTGPTISQLQIQQQQQPLYHPQSQHAYYTLDPKQHQLNPATVGYCNPQQQQQQQHFVPVDLNGWVLEI